ncbi:DUF4232 domain-containing protein [Streptomyces griseoviridis]|uniref:DUF4232 domain-containing protein n=1 Tax=Streptomyces TaxID=1883 RepID=UPI002473FE81|nr:DUF4232 domain-containing protein [Streptomyces sp. MAA16]MDH6696141.1 hypothetical protein [Streptomyces sp. MAA16]
MANNCTRVRHAAWSVSAVALLGLLTACGGGGDSAGGPSTLSGTAAPATGGSASGSASPAPSATPTGGATDGTAGAETSSGGTPSEAVSASGSVSTRCHTSELRASVGRDNPGAGQENFPIVLTNTSSHSCTLRGYPGAAFRSAAGKQLGPDPKRSSGSPDTVTLTPGASAWAGLSFSNPEVSEAKAATPASLLVTPPDERDALTVKWPGGQVPVSGNSSSVFLTVFAPGTGA